MYIYVPKSPEPQHPYHALAVSSARSTANDASDGSSARDKLNLHPAKPIFLRLELLWLQAVLCRACRLYTLWLFYTSFYRKALAAFGVIVLR